MFALNWFILFDCAREKIIKVFQDLVTSFSAISSEINGGRDWWDNDFSSFQTRAKRPRFVKMLHFWRSLHPRYTGVISSKKALFFQLFLSCHLVILIKKINFWKMKKILSKISKKGLFLPVWGRKGVCVNTLLLKDPFLSTFTR